MTELQANVVARALGGRSWHSGGGIWLVLFDWPDGSIVCISDESVCEYRSEGHFEAGESAAAIRWRYE